VHEPRIACLRPSGTAPYYIGRPRPTKGFHAAPEKVAAAAGPEDSREPPAADGRGDPASLVFLVPFGLRRIVIGNHTFSHLRLFCARAPSRLRMEIERTFDTYPQALLARVLGRINPGETVLMDDRPARGMRAMLPALPDLVDRLRNLNCQFTTP
jgi:hypothetical protein